MQTREKKTLAAFRYNANICEGALEEVKAGSVLGQ